LEQVVIYWGICLYLIQFKEINFLVTIISAAPIRKIIGRTRNFLIIIHRFLLGQYRFIILITKHLLLEIFYHFLLIWAKLREVLSIIIGYAQLLIGAVHFLNLIHWSFFLILEDDIVFFLLFL